MSFHTYRRVKINTLQKQLTMQTKTLLYLNGFSFIIHNDKYSFYHFMATKDPVQALGCTILLFA